MDGCIFCKIVQKDIPAEIVYETDTVLAFRDIQAQAPVHILVIPKQHISNILGFGGNDGTLLEELMEAIKNITVSSGIDRQGFRVVANTGPDGGQAVDHIHFHVLGGRQMTWPPG